MRLALLSAVLAACTSPDPVPEVDAPPPTVDAPPSGACLIPPSYGALGAITGTTGTAAGGATTITVTLDAGPPKDSFFIRLEAGKGVFAGGLAAGTYTIAGADANYTTCGLCANVIADIVAGQGPSKFYFANAGTITLDTITAPITGTVANLQYTEIQISDGTTIPGCTTSITSASFTAN